MNDHSDSDIESLMNQLKRKDADCHDEKEEVKASLGLTLGEKSLILLAQGRTPIAIDELLKEAFDCAENDFAQTSEAEDELADTYGLDVRFDAVTINRRLGKAPRH
jgi:hypothetical protein